MFVYRLCRCTNNYMSKLTKEMDDDCNVPCNASGNASNEKCRTHFKMFKTYNTSLIGIYILKVSDSYILKIGSFRMQII